jgi:hypothetical protein
MIDLCFIKLAVTCNLRHNVKKGTNTEEKGIVSLSDWIVISFVTVKGITFIVWEFKSKTLT